MTIQAYQRLSTERKSLTVIKRAQARFAGSIAKIVYGCDVTSYDWEEMYRLQGRVAGLCFRHAEIFSGRV